MGVPAQGVPLGRSAAAARRAWRPVLDPDEALMTTSEVAEYLGLSGDVSAWLRRRGVEPVGQTARRANLYPREVVTPLAGEPTSGRRARAPYDRWRDVDGAPVAVGARVEQAGADRTRGALPSRLGARGVVVGRTRSTRLLVRFDGEGRVVSIRPDLVRVIGDDHA